MRTVVLGTLDVEVPELLVAREGNVISHGEVGELVVNAPGCVRDHVAHIDVGQKVAHEEGVLVAYSQLRGTMLTQEPLDVGGMDVPARHGRFPSLHV